MLVFNELRVIKEIIDEINMFWIEQILMLRVKIRVIKELQDELFLVNTRHLILIALLWVSDIFDPAEKHIIDDLVVARNLEQIHEPVERIK